jgi:hypothetical protein
MLGHVKPWNATEQACPAGQVRINLTWPVNDGFDSGKGAIDEQVRRGPTKSFNPAPSMIPQTQRPIIRPRSVKKQTVLPCFLLSLALCATSVPSAAQSRSAIDEINTEFHFLGPDDTILIHEEEGRLKGQIDAYQDDDESDTVLSYAFTIGQRKNDHVEFKTAEIHRRYYRFSGTVVRGSGQDEKDEDYLRLVGELQIITVDGSTGKESVVKKQVELKSLSADEISDE